MGNLDWFSGCEVAGSPWAWASRYVLDLVAQEPGDIYPGQGTVALRS